MIIKFLKRARNFTFYRTYLGDVITGLHHINQHYKYSFNPNSFQNDKSKVKYYLTKQYHIIEKGLALPNPRPGFGEAKIIDLIEKTQQYEDKFGPDSLTTSIRKTLKEYLSFHKVRDLNLPNHFEFIILSFLNHNNGNHASNLQATGGLKAVSKSTSSIINLSQYNEFAHSRVSVRDFSDSPVSIELIKSIVSAAQSAPSVCNRQAWKAHLYSDKSEISHILSYQNGNSGFTNSIDKLLIVTGDTKGFTKFENNQIFIDGGLFSMNLLLAIHSSGLGACALNTCYPYYLEKEVKHIANIPNHEKLIMMIAVGNLKENFKVAYSTRNSVSDVLVNH